MDNLRKVVVTFLAFILMVNTVDWYFALSVGISVACLLNLLIVIGKKFPVFEILEVIVCVQLLLAPMVTYSSTHLQEGYQMEIPASEYYSFILPAVVAFFVGLNVSLKNKRLNSIYTIDRLKKFATSNKNYGLLLTYISAPFNLLYGFFPMVTKNIAANLGYLIYVGLTLTILGNPGKSTKLKVYGIFIFITVYRSVVSGMFTEIATWSGFIGAIVLMNRHFVPLYKKAIFFLLGAALILFMQSMKNDYREVAWSQVERSADNDNSTVFTDLVIDRIKTPALFLGEQNFIRTANRLNQGLIISKVIHYIPQYESFADGETLYKAIAASLVPRFIWKDKPLNSGTENMLRFTGVPLEGDNSSNVGTFGEAYGNFGLVGGVFFMFLYALFFNLVLNYLLGKCHIVPQLFAWLPFIFVSIITIEGDILSNLNTLAKGLMFMYVFLKVYTVLNKNKNRVDKEDRKGTSGIYTIASAPGR